MLCYFVLEKQQTVWGQIKGFFRHSSFTWNYCLFGIGAGLGSFIFPNISNLSMRKPYSPLDFIIRHR